MKAEYTYYAGNNYLKLDMEEDYRVQMLLSQKLQGLLELEKNCINGEIHYLYRISGMQSLKSRYSLRPFTKEVYSGLLESILALAGQLEKHLLDIRDIVFDPEYIYQDMETKEIRFIYFPGYHKNLADNLLDFYLFLLEHIEGEEDFVKDVYLTYDKIDEAGELFHINMLHLPKQEEKVEEMTHPIIEQPIVYEDVEEIKEVPKEDSNSRMWILFLLDGIFVYFLFHRFVLSDIRFIAGVAVILVVNVIAILFNWKKQKAESSLKESCQNEMPDPVREYVETLAPEEYGKTLFLDPGIIPDEKRLYGIGKGNSYVLSLEKTPYTIGKEKEFVDGILPHESVSRMHARITEEEEQLYLEDLNSTNGTFKNGVRLIPLEKVELEAGDEIKIGTLRFTYR